MIGKAKVYIDGRDKPVSDPLEDAIREKLQSFKAHVPTRKEPPLGLRPSFVWKSER